MTYKCSDCGFELTVEGSEPRKVIRSIREHLIPAKLFCCDKCVKELTELLKIFQKKEDVYADIK